MTCTGTHQSSKAASNACALLQVAPLGSKAAHSALAGVEQRSPRHQVRVLAKRDPTSTRELGPHGSGCHWRPFLPRLRGANVPARQSSTCRDRCRWQWGDHDSTLAMPLAMQEWRTMSQNGMGSFAKPHAICCELTCPEPEHVFFQSPRGWSGLWTPSGISSSTPSMQAGLKGKPQ